MKPKTTDEVFALLDAYTTSAALGAAMELGLFWLLAQGPLDIPAVAEALDIPSKRCLYWLLLLSRTGLIEKVPAGFANSPTAQSTILEAYSQATWAFLAREGRERFPSVLDLAEHIRLLGSVWAAQGLTPPDYFHHLMESPERARQFTRMLYEIHLPMADALAQTLDLSGVRRLMDLGGGSGVMSLALLRRDQDLSAVVVDIPNVCAAGRQIAVEVAADEPTLAGRITHHPANFLEDELPSGFDMVLECDVGVYNEALLHKLRAALNPGGRLIIVDKFATPDGLPSPSRLTWAFQGSLENPEASPRLAADLLAGLAAAGFEITSEGPLPAPETRRWSRGWVLIEAHT